MSPTFRKSSLHLVLAVVLFTCNHWAFGQLLFDPDEQTATARVAEVRVEGNKRTATEKILEMLKTRPGRPFDPVVLQEDLRKLNESRLFVTARVQLAESPQGKIVTFQVVERPVLQYVKVVGNDAISKKTLLEQAGIKEGDPLDVFAVEEARRRMEEYYHTRGFAKAYVEIVEGNHPDDAGAVFVIHEGPKQKVLWTSFVGNTIASDAKLRSKIKTKPGIAWLLMGNFSREQLEQDQQTLLDYYRSLGFFRARVGEPIVEYVQDGQWVKVTFVIDEGPRYKVRYVRFVGNKVFSEEQLREGLKLVEGQFFSRNDLQRDLKTLQDKYGAHGYIFADINAEPRFLEEPGLLDLVYVIDEGQQYRVGKINVQIKGDNPHTRITTVLNRMSVYPGQIVDVRELRASERRLRASQLFEVDPSTGELPKIVVKPPEELPTTNIAQQPGRQNQNTQGPTTRTVYRPAWQQEQTEDPTNATETTSPSGVGVPEPGEASPARKFDVIRGQYSPDSGVSLPPLDAPGSWFVPPQAVLPRKASPDASAGESRQVYQPSTSYQQSAVSVMQQSGAYQPTGRDNYQQAGEYATGAQPAYPQVYAQAGSYGESAASAPADSLQSVGAGVEQAYQGSTSVVSASQPVGGPTADQDRAAEMQAGYLAPANPVGSRMFTPGQNPIQPQDMGPLLGIPPDQQPAPYVPLYPQVKEARTGRLMIAAGVNSDAGLIGSVIIDEQNFDICRFPRSWREIWEGTAWRGAGQRFRLEAVPGTELHRYTVMFQEPYLFDSNVSLATSGYYYTRRYWEWDEQRLGGRVALGYQFTHDLSGTLAFRAMNITIYDPASSPGVVPEIDEVLGDNDLYGLSVSLTHDTRDNAFLPTEGHYFELGFEQVIGAFDYPRANIDLRRYFLLREHPDGTGRHVLSLSGKLFITGANTPIYEHFFAGGYSTLRGFDYRGATPVDSATGSIHIGGEFMMLASIEYIFPITADDMIKAVIFCDTGTVEPRIDHWTDRYRVAPGFGFRISLPMMGPAPIALDFAFPVSKEPTDDEQVFSFFVGFLR